MIVKANYADIMATITDREGNVTYYSDEYIAQNEWYNAGGTLTLYTDARAFHLQIPANGVLNLNEHTMEADRLFIVNPCTIENGTVIVRHGGDIGTNAVVIFKNVTLSKEDDSSSDVQIVNNGMIVDAGLTLNGVTISGGTIKTMLTDARVMLSGIPVSGYVYDGFAHEPDVMCSGTALVKGTDYIVTFRNSSGGDSTVNAGTVTMTITGIGDYTGMVTKTYIIGKAQAAIAVNTADVVVTYGQTVTLPAATTNFGTVSCDTAAADLVNAGTYTVTYTVAGTGNYDGDSKTVTVIIKAKPVTAADVALNGTLTYTGSGQTQSITVARGITYEVSGNKATNAGTYELTVKGTGNYTGEVKLSWTIRKAVSAVGTAPEAKELTYTGQAQALVTAGTAAGGKLVYSLTENGQYSESIPNGTNAAAYTVWYYVQGDGNHTDSTKNSVSVTVAKADPGIGAVSAGVVKDTLATSAIVLTRANTTVKGTLAVDAGQSLVWGSNELTYTFTPDDTANYKAVTGTVTVTVADTAAPTGTVTIATNSWTSFLNNITFGLFFKETQTVSVAAEDSLSGVAGIAYYETKDILDVSQVAALSADKWTAMTGGSVNVTVEDTKQFIYYIRITDKAGNIAYLATDGAEFDTTAPTISGVLSGTTYYTTQTVTVADKNLKTVTLNGEAVTGSVTLAGNKEATYTIVATDQAGNSTTVSVKMAPIAAITEGVDGKTASNVTSDDRAKLQAVVDAATELLKDEGMNAAEKAELEKTKADAEDLIQTIDKNAAAQKAAADKASEFQTDSVNSTDKAELEKLSEEIEKLLNSENLTKDERAALETVLEQVNDMIGTVDKTATDSKTAADAIGAYDPSTVKSSDKAAIETALASIEKLLESSNLTEEERKTLEAAQADAKALLDVIEKAAAGSETESTSKVESVTPENVKPENKADLEKAKADLEKVLENNGGNYTAEEKKTIEDEIKRIESALKVIENVETFEDAVSDLPAAVEPDDEETVAKIEEAKKAYSGLTDYEKSLVDPELKAKVDALADAAVAYDIVKGGGSAWRKGTDGTISFTANGPVSKFTVLKVDGEAVDTKHYEVKSGSTIITLKASYLKTLAVGEHTLTVVYSDGETSDVFTVQAKSPVPATGDEANILLWTALCLFSMAAITALIVYNKRFAYKAKYVRK